MEEIVPEIPFVRGEVLEKVNRVVYYVKTRALIATIREQIHKLEDEIDAPPNETWSKNEKIKQMQISRNNHNRLEALKKNEERMRGRLMGMEKQIKIDIASEK